MALEMQEHVLQSHSSFLCNRQVNPCVHIFVGWYLTASGLPCL